MEWLLLPAIGVIIWLVTRTVQQEQQLEALTRRLKQAEDTGVNQASSASSDAERLRGQVLELVRAHSQLQRRLEDIQEVINAEPVRTVSPSAIAQVAPTPPHALPAYQPSSVETEPTPSPDIVPVSSLHQEPSQSMEANHALADATFAAAEAAGLAETAPSQGINVADSLAPVVPETTIPRSNLETPPSVAPIAPSFDWEQLLGVRGAAWLGGIALAVAGTLFAKYSIENGLIGPQLRIILLILLALSALVGSEFFLRPRYEATASTRRAVLVLAHPLLGVLCRT